MKLEEWANEMPRLDKSGCASKEAVEGLQDAIERGRTLNQLPREEELRKRLATFMGDYGAWSPNSRTVVHIIALLRDHLAHDCPNYPRKVPRCPACEMGLPRRLMK